MQLTKPAIVTIAIASGLTLGAVADEIIGGAVLDTPFAYNAQVVAVKFKYFNNKYNADHQLDNDDKFKNVLNFVKNPRGAKLIAIPAASNPATEEITEWTYQYIPRKAAKTTPQQAEKQAPQGDKKIQDTVTVTDQGSAPGEDSKISWNNIKKDKDLLKSYKYTWKIQNVKQDWEAVNQFLKDFQKPYDYKHYITCSADEYGAVAFAYEDKNDGNKPKVAYYKGVSSDYLKKHPKCEVCSAKKLQAGFDAAAKIISIQGSNEKISQERAILYRNLDHLVK